MSLNDNETPDLDSDDNSDLEDRTIAISHLVSSPTPLVYEAFTSGEHLARWWGPQGFTIEDVRADVRPGGQWRFKMIGPEGEVYKNRIRYTLLQPPTRIEYLHDADFEDDPDAFEVVVTLIPEDGGTRVEMKTVFSTLEQAEAVLDFGGVELGQSTLASLDAYLQRQ